MTAGQLMGESAGLCTTRVLASALLTVPTTAAASEKPGGGLPTPLWRPPPALDWPETVDLFTPTDPRAQLHADEVRSVVRMYREKGKEAVIEFLNLVERHRGKDSRDRLEADALAAIRPGAVYPPA